MFKKGSDYFTVLMHSDGLLICISANKIKGNRRALGLPGEINTNTALSAYKAFGGYTQKNPLQVNRI